MPKRHRDMPFSRLDVAEKQSSAMCKVVQSSAGLKLKSLFAAVALHLARLRRCMDRWLPTTLTISAAAASATRTPPHALP
jgi:hypothetical protein